MGSEVWHMAVPEEWTEAESYDDDGDATFQPQHQEMDDYVQPHALHSVFQNHFEPAVYVFAKCGYELFSSRSKYEHSVLWPAFTGTIHDDSVAAKWPERNHPDAFKVFCSKCSHGLLNDGPKRGSPASEYSAVPEVHP
ncbi:methionine-R-sulfoxide reductase B1-like [Echinops telfairi]|uniref:Methionine-R-sulfoxide reductase B1-like n=1 Tax=Echinops telfairi TaxID=9371 RepID=A0AC55DJB8_ECHTE|nr:methionine-R-sulfoxide reductase B1-like [Echinops telfairi]